MANDKVFSVRADEDTIQKLEAVAEQSGMKKAELLPVLLDVYAREQAKGALPGRADEIDNVRSLLAQLDHAYLASLEANANAEARIRDEYAARISTQEQATASLKEATTKAKADADQARADAAEARKEADAAAKELAAVKSELEKARADADAQAARDAETISTEKKFNETLQKQLADQTEKLDAAQAAAADVPELKKAKEAAEAAKRDESDRADRAEAKAAALEKELKEAREKAKDDLTEQKGRAAEKLDNLRDKLEAEKKEAVLQERESQMKKSADDLAKWQKKYEDLLAKFAEKAGQPKPASKPAQHKTTKPAAKPAQPKSATK